MASAPHAFLFIPPTSGRVVITFNGTPKDNACDPSGDTTVSQRGEDKAKKAGCGAKCPCDGTTVARGGDDEVNIATAGSGTKRPYDAIKDGLDQSYHCRAKTEPGSSQVDKVPNPKYLHGPLTGFPSDVDDSATESESSADMDGRGWTKPSYFK